jgi:hypothetical protein
MYVLIKRCNIAVSDPYNHENRKTIKRLKQAQIWAQAAGTAFWVADL